MELSVKFINIERVEKAVMNLSDVDKNRAIKKGLGEGSRVFINFGKRTLMTRMKNPRGVSGRLLKSFTGRVKRRKLGALAGFEPDIAYWAHMVDRGTVQRKNVRAKYKSGKNRGILKANYFWRDTFNSYHTMALNKVYLGIENAVKNIITK